MGNAQQKLEDQTHQQPASAGPRGRGAVSAITGGEPEDINQMPPTYLPDEEGPIYDGSDLGRGDLARGEAVENVPTEEDDTTLEP